MINDPEVLKRAAAAKEAKRKAYREFGSDRPLRMVTTLSCKKCGGKDGHPGVTLTKNKQNGLLEHLNCPGGIQEHVSKQIRDVKQTATKVTEKIRDIVDQVTHR